MRVGSGALVFLLLSVVLAGCAEDAGPNDGGDENLGEPETIEATSTTGGIRGVVVDSAITPIQDASIKVLNTDKTATTDANGNFVISGLDAGTYFVEATHPLYDTQQSSVEVKAGVENPPVVKIQLTRLISTEPYMETLQMQGHVICSTNIDEVGYSEECGEGMGYPCDLPDTVYSCGERIGRQDGSQPQIWFRVTATPVKTFIVEQVWEPSVSAATGNTEDFYTRLSIDWICDPFCGGRTLGTVTAGSPLLLRIDAERIAEMEEAIGGPINPETDLSTFVYSGAENGVILDQSYEQFVSIFYSLEAPEGWSFVNGDRSPYAGN